MYGHLAGTKTSGRNNEVAIISPWLQRISRRRPKPKFFKSTSGSSSVEYSADVEDTGVTSHLMCSSVIVKDEYQSVLCALKSLFMFFCFASCKTSQNVNISQLIHEVNSKFHVNHHYGYEASCFVLSHITWWNNFAAVKLNEAAGKRIWKASKIRYVDCNGWHRFALHWVRLIMFINIRVLRLRSIDWKSSLSISFNSGE